MGTKTGTISEGGGGERIWNLSPCKEFIPFQHTQGLKSEKVKVGYSAYQKKNVVQRLAVGESQRSVTKEVGIDHSQISRFSNREDIRAIIEEEQIRLAEFVPDAVENVKELVREMKKIPKKDIRRLELSYKASLDTLKSVGIMPSPVQSQVMTNI